MKLDSITIPDPERPGRKMRVLDDSPAHVVDMTGRQSTRATAACTAPTATRPDMTTPALVPCPRCGGTNFVPRYAHHDRGACYRCRGRGVVPSRTAAESESAYADAEAARLRAIDALRAARLSGLTAEADRLAALPPITDSETAGAAAETLAVAYRAAAAGAGIYDTAACHAAAIAALEAIRAIRAITPEADQ